MDDILLWILVCIGIPLVGVIIFLWGFLSERSKKRKNIESARANYEHALSNLRDLPGDPAAQQEAVRYGKAYVELAQFDSEDPFTEGRLLDELNAAQPSAPPLTSLSEAEPEDKDPNSIGNQLQDLEEQKQKGLISDADYHAKRLEIFDQL